MLAHLHGELWNSSALGRSLGVSEKTARRYLDILAGSYMVRVLPPWFENLKKRQVRSPKIYLRDSGVLHGLLGIEVRDQLLGHPKLGASWEGFVIEQIIDRLPRHDFYFWATHQGAELDVLTFHRTHRLGFEIKFSDAPRLTKSMRIAREDLNLDQLWVVHPGQDSWPMAEGVTAVAFSRSPRETRRDRMTPSGSTRLAEGRGFEPLDPVKDQRFSRPILGFERHREG